MVYLSGRFRKTCLYRPKNSPPHSSPESSRSKALANIRLVRRGGDPRRRDRTVPTVMDVVEKVIARDEVTSAECTAVLAAMWNGKRDTASKLRQRLTAVFKLVVAEGHRGDNPVERAHAALPNQRELMARWANYVATRN